MIDWVKKITISVLVFLLTLFSYAGNNSKKGVGMTNGSGDYAKKHYMLGVDWTTNWNIDKNVDLPDGIDYTPHRWGMWWPGFSNLEGMGATHILGHNEPDGSSQANMTVAQSIADYQSNIFPNAQTYNLLVGTPATTNYNNDWMVDFYAEATAAGLVFDFTAMHWYKAPNADTLMSHIDDCYSRYGYKKVWITEFNVADWTAPNNYTEEQSCTFMCEAMWRMGHSSKLERYAIFPWNGDSSASEASPIIVDGKLTPLGKVYANFTDADLLGPTTGVWYNMHNKSGHIRLADDSDAVSYADINVDDATVEFRLEESYNSGEYYVINANNGLKLRDYEGSLQFVPVSYTGAKVRWRVEDGSNGWRYFISCDSGKKLRYSSGVLSMSTVTDDTVKWFPLRAGSAINEIAIEAEDGVLAMPGNLFEVASDAGASGGEYIVYPVGDTIDPDDVEWIGHYSYVFNVDTTADIVFSIVADLPLSTSDSFSYRIDQGPWITNYGTTTAGWERLEILKFPGLSAGNHVISIAARESGAKFDEIILGTTQGNIYAGTERFRTVEFEAEDAQNQVNFDQFTLYQDSMASGASYIAKPGVGVFIPTPADTDPANFIIDFTLTQDCDLELSANTNFPTTNDDSFYFKLDDGSWNEQNYDYGAGWTVRKISQFDSLSAGEHKLYIMAREDGAMIDKFIFKVNAGAVEITNPQGDIDGSMFVSLQDFAMFSMGWFSTGCELLQWCDGLDIDMSGAVGIDDLIILSAKWLRTTPLHYISFDDGLYDAGIGRSDLYAINGAMQSNDGVVGNAFDLNATEAVVEFLGDKGITGTSNRTCAMWIKTTQVDGQLLCWGLPETGRKWIVRLDTSGKLRTEVTGGSIIGEQVVNDGTWHHIAVVLDGDGVTPKVSDIKLYVDGIYQTPSSIIDNYIDTAYGANVTIGAYPTLSKEFYNGMIDELRIYDRALTAYEVELLSR